MKSPVMVTCLLFCEVLRHPLVALLTHVCSSVALHINIDWSVIVVN